jgi:hypothetical protein
MTAELPNIALRAYQLWDAAGRPDGRSDEFYFQAEEEFRRLIESEAQSPNNVAGQTDWSNGS